MVFQPDTPKKAILPALPLQRPLPPVPGTSSNFSYSGAAKSRGPSAHPASKLAVAPVTGPTAGIQDARKNDANGSQHPGPAAITEAMSEAKISERLVPSLAPPPSHASLKTRFALSQNPRDIVVHPDNRHAEWKAGWFDNGICIMSPYEAKHFFHGDVISVPVHLANMNPNIDKYGKEIQMSAHGPVFSKRRMFIVFYKGPEAMACLPLSSWQGEGIGKKNTGAGSLNDFVCVVNYKDKKAFNQSGQLKGPHPPLLFVHRHDNSGGLSLATVCTLVGLRMIGYTEDVARVGRITQESFQALSDLWEERNSFYWSQQTDSFPPEGEQDPRWKKFNAPRFGGGSRAPSRITPSQYPNSQYGGNGRGRA